MKINKEWQMFYCIRKRKANGEFEYLREIYDGFTTFTADVNAAIKFGSSAPAFYVAEDLSKKENIKCYPCVCTLQIEELKEDVVQNEFNYTKKVNEKNEKKEEELKEDDE